MKKIRYDTGFYKVWCNNCKYVVTSYNDYHTARKSKRFALVNNNRHYKHDIVIIEGEIIH